MKGFFGSRGWLVNRFLVRWDKKIEIRIAPPKLPGWWCVHLEEENIDANE
jgi:hypothetical protein